MEELNGNLPENVVTRQENVAGRNVDVIYNEADTEFTTPIGAKDPDGLEGDELDKFHNDVKNEFKMKVSANDKYAEAAKLKREIEEKQAKLERDMKEWESKKASYTPPAPPKVETSDAPDFYKVLSELSGETIRDIDDALEFEEDNKKLYRKAEMKYNKLRDNYILSNTKTTNPQEIIEKSLLRDKITREGADYASVEQFAKLRGWNVDAFAYDAFKNANPKQTSETEKINKFTQPTDFIWVGSGKKITTAGVKPLADSFETDEELTNYIEAEMNKENPDPRVLEFLKDK